YSRAPGGYSSSQSYGNISEAPTLGDIYNSGSCGGYYGSGNNSNSYQMQEPSSARNALMNDIRNRRPSQQQPQSGYGNIPEAPALGEAFNRAPGSSSGYGIQSGFSNRPNNIFSEFRQRASQPGMGLRPTQTRPSGAYPSNG